MTNRYNKKMIWNSLEMFGDCNKSLGSGEYNKTKLKNVNIIHSHNTFMQNTKRGRTENLLNVLYLDFKNVRYF